MGTRLVGLKVSIVSTANDCVGVVVNHSRFSAWTRFKILHSVRPGRRTATLDLYGGASDPMIHLGAGEWTYRRGGFEVR
jgi:hypothetical protein